MKQNINIGSKILNLEHKLDTLTKLISSARECGIDPALQQVTVTVGKKFIDYIKVDAEHGEDYYAAKKFSDFDIIGKAETLKRLSTLVPFELAETENIITQAIAEIRQMLNSSERQLHFPARSPKNAYIKNGTFYSGKTPLFLNGLYYRYTDQNSLSDLKALGANLIGPESIACHTDWQAEDKYTDFIAKRIKMMKIYAQEGFYIAPFIWIYHNPKWFIKKYPEMNVEEKSFDDATQALKCKVNGWFRNSMDIDHPKLEDFYHRWFSRIGNKLKSLPNMLFYTIMGEEWCMPSFRGQYTQKRYTAWLEKKYEKISRLNELWQTDYKSFCAAATPESVNSTGGRFAWYTFNEYRLTTLNQWQIDAISSVDSKANIAPWPGAGGLLNSPPGGLDPMLGRNREAIIKQSTGIVAWDGALLPYEAGATTKHLPPEHWDKYNMGWRDEIIYYDFAKSLSPEKPIFDPELHSVTAWHCLPPLGLSADYLTTALWLQHLHGLSAHLMWMLRSRQLSGNPRELEFTGSLQTQPQLLEAWGRTCLQLQRLAKYITLFPQLERQVKILYSESSAIQQNSLDNNIDENFIAAPDDNIFANYVMKIYEALYFLDYQVGFTTEATIADQGLKDCKLLVIPNAQYVSQTTVDAIKRYRQQGGTVAIVGKDALKYDEHGNARDISSFINTKKIYLQGNSAEEYSPQLDHLMTKAGISRSIRVFDRNGDNAWGVEMRVAEKAGRKIFYLINLNKQTLEVTLKMQQLPQQAFELGSRRLIDISKPLILEPRKPLLILLEKKI